MAILQAGDLSIEYAETGSGPTVVLLHSSASSLRQWRRLSEELSDSFRVIAINLLGYGATSPWPGPGRQRLTDQARLVALVLEGRPGPAGIVGHSFGGAVAMQAALELGGGVGRLVLVEPNPFHLLALAGRAAAYDEIQALCDAVYGHEAAGERLRMGEVFYGYWSGEGAWEAMPAARRESFVAQMAPVLHEFGAVLGETRPLAGWRRIPARTLVLTARDTRRPVVEIAELLRAADFGWRFVEVPEGGHMAPLTRPDLVNPLVRQFLSEVP